MYKDKPLLHQRQKEYVQGALRSLTLDVTPKCNMHCSHCYADPFAHVDTVGIEVVERMLDEAYGLGVQHYVLQGGEPILAPDRLEAIINKTRPDECYITVVSNGWAMTEEKIRHLKELKVDKIAFSLDSGIPEEHDTNRCKGSYDKVMHSIDLVIKSGLLTSISTMVTHESLYGEGFRKAHEFALRKKIRLDIQIAMPVGKLEGQKDLLMTKEDSAHIYKMWQESPALDTGQTLINRDVFNFGGECHCPAGKEFLGITANGHIFPCNFCQTSLGNIRDTTLEDARKALLTNHWFATPQPLCLVGENKEFIQEYIEPNVGAPKPLDAHALFKLKRGE